MSDKILVDTSAWILSFRETGNEKLKNYLREALDSNKVVITNIIILELLQGCKNKREYEALKSRLGILERYTLNEKAWNLAYKTGFSLKRKGITTPTIDILISSIAKENNLTVLHHDNHLKTLAHEVDIKAIDFM